VKSNNKKLFLAFIEKLEPIERACLLLTTMGGASQRECATLFKVSHSTISRIISRAKKKARA